MTFLGIGPGELFLVLIIALVVVGPERLPGFARQLGKWIVGLRNWIQSSPDAQLLLRARDELEEEFRTIRSDLAQEMQSVREEMLQATREATLDATRQLDEVTAAARDAAAQIEQATETAADKIDSAADVAVEEASAEIEQIAHEAAAEAAQEVTHDLASELGERTGVGPATSAPDAPHIPTPLSSAGDMNGQPVARTSRPGAPQPQNENAPGQGVWIDAETHA
ncbi:MAG TPA: twin-arginine translocase TatA/TatE family subunit, partial [Roseiflexaceae bacterium]|nr:twin-arginine translocase TatA/TatE family subunit [Roseiflexaceae bacterium]